MKKIAQILACVLLGALGLLGAVLFLLAILDTFFALITTHRIDADHILIIIMGLIPLAIGGGGLWLILLIDKCPACKKLFAMKPARTEFLGKENISVKQELNNYDSNHDVIGTHEQYVPGTREYYRKWYVCKYCGNKYYKNFKKDYPNV